MKNERIWRVTIETQPQTMDITLTELKQEFSIPNIEFEEWFDALPTQLQAKLLRRYAGQFLSKPGQTITFFEYGGKGR